MQFCSLQALISSGNEVLRLVPTVLPHKSAGWLISLRDACV